jgi:DNA-binding helix-hairpin-helix protein with protein kinase domain
LKIGRGDGLKQSLVESKRSFESLVAEEREKVSKYQLDRRERQLTSYLERFHIRHVKISGIGHAKEAALASYGIETAADVDIGKVLAVPGLGRSVRER